MSCAALFLPYDPSKEKRTLPVQKNLSWSPQHFKDHWEWPHGDIGPQLLSGFGMTNGVGPSCLWERKVNSSIMLPREELYWSKSSWIAQVSIGKDLVCHWLQVIESCKEARGVMRSGASPVLPHSPAPGSLPGLWVLWLPQWCAESELGPTQIYLKAGAPLPLLELPRLLIFPNVSKMHGAPTNVRELPYRPGFQSNKSIGSFLESWRGKL